MEQTIDQQFNRIAKEYDANRRKFIPCFDEFYKETTAFLARYINKPAHILDLGAGTGLLTAFWYEHFPQAEYVLVDVAQQMLDVARRRFAALPNVAYTVSDYADGLPSVRFDTVISALSVHHLEDGQKQRLFNDVFAKLPAGGCFVNYDQFCYPDAQLDEEVTAFWEHRIREAGIGEHDMALMHERRKLDRECSVADELRMLRAAGFTSPSCLYQCSKFAVIAALK